MKKKIISIIIIVAILAGSLYFIQKLLEPKYATSIIEGRLTQEYYDYAHDNDVLMVGDCELYENISPIKMWEDYGITSYVRGSGQQLIWQSYYLLEEALTYEKPKVVVFNVLSMKYNEPQNEAYNRLTLDKMRWCPSKWNAINASMTDDEEFISYVFPLLRYHSRWSELTSEDFEYLFTNKKFFHQGYLMRVDVRPVTSYPAKIPLADYNFGANAYKYLDMIREICEKNNIPLVLVKAPSISPVWYDEWDAQMVDYAEKYNLQYINFLNLVSEVGIDYNTDTYDGGLHLNLSGAEKMATYFGKILKDTYGLADHRLLADEHDKQIVSEWEEKVDFYNWMIADQYREMEEYGYLKSYGAKAPEQ